MTSTALGSTSVVWIAPMEPLVSTVRRRDGAASLAPPENRGGGRTRFSDMTCHRPALVRLSLGSAVRSISPSRRSPGETASCGLFGSRLARLVRAELDRSTALTVLGNSVRDGLEVYLRGIGWGSHGPDIAERRISLVPARRTPGLTHNCGGTVQPRSSGRIPRSLSVVVPPTLARTQGYPVQGRHNRCE